ncbi:MAG: toprim domain-containing protein [Leeuwenhoekiella sp.]
MFDLLSLITIHPNLKREADFLILNSIAFAKKALPLFDNYKTVELYLDRDTAGRKTTDFFLTENSKCIDKSDCCMDFKDLNTWLLSMDLN